MRRQTLVKTSLAHIDTGFRRADGPRPFYRHVNAPSRSRLLTPKTLLHMHVGEPSEVGHVSGILPMPLLSIRSTGRQSMPAHV